MALVASLKTDATSDRTRKPSSLITSIARDEDKLPQRRPLDVRSLSHMIRQSAIESSESS
jgi:hypothetical protein